MGSTGVVRRIIIGKRRGVLEYTVFTKDEKPVNLLNLQNLFNLSVNAMDLGEAFLRLSVKFYSVGKFSRNNKRGKPPFEWKCYNFRAEIKQRKGFPHGYYNKNWRNLE